MGQGSCPWDPHGLGRQCPCSCRSMSPYCPVGNRAVSSSPLLQQLPLWLPSTISTRDPTAPGLGGPPALYVPPAKPPSAVCWAQGGEGLQRGSSSSTAKAQALGIEGWVWQLLPSQAAPRPHLLPCPCLPSVLCTLLFSLHFMTFLLCSVPLGD